MKPSRGFSLVELTVIVAVVALLAGASVIPNFVLSQDNIYEEEERRLAEIRGAIFGYAARHRTPGGAVAEVSDADGGSTRPFVLPGGRPFLPCPDITGDGYEDRADVAVVGFSTPPVAMTFALTSTIADGDRVAVRDFRNCESPRGVLPWRTLGVPPADHWGNLYTYHVDDVFADGLSGFNQNTESNAYDSRTVLAPVTITIGGTMQAVDLYLSRESAMQPLVICQESAVCSADRITNLSITLAAGQRTEDPFAGGVGTDFAAADVVEGVPFAIVSHGENGLGAANYQTNVRNTASMPSLICKHPIGGGNSTQMTALASMPEAFNFPVVESAPLSDCRNSTVDGVATGNGFMITRTRSVAGQSEFDDIVMWVSRDDLLDAMRRGGALPARDFPALRPY